MVSCKSRKKVSIGKYHEMTKECVKHDWLMVIIAAKVEAEKLPIIVISSL
jgi:hypothetical protein